MTFTGRTYMWDAAIRVINQSPIWGYGYPDREWYMANMTTRAIGAHNYILNTMIYGGVILLIIYISAIVKSIAHLIKINDVNSMRLMSAFGVFNIMMLFEVYETPLVFLLLTIMYYYPGQEPQSKPVKNE